MKQFSQIKNNFYFSEELPADKIDANNSRQVYESCFSYVETKRPTKPEMVHYSDHFVNELGIKVDRVGKDLELLSGLKKFDDVSPYAMCYGGHQFGNWAGQLGDGRAINIAEANLNGNNWKFQLKGAGPTPNSRGADGLAVLRSSVREYEVCVKKLYGPTGY